MSTNPWHECSCGAKADAAAHSYDNGLDADCNICGYNRNIPAHPDPSQGEGYSIDYTQEKVTVTSGYEINTKGDGTGEAVNTGATVTPGSTLYIRKSSDDSHQPSGWVEVVIPARPSAPAGVSAVSETAPGANDGKITGVSTVMEYSSDGGATWTACSGTEVTPLAPGNYQVRTKATGDAFAGTPITVTVPAKAAPTHYTVVFDSMGGSNVGNQTVAVGGKATQPTNPTRRGYTFNGWYTEPGCIHRWNFENAPTGDLILYAKWVENTYSISGTVTEGTGGAATAVSGATVKLMQGNTTIATTTSDGQGRYSFAVVAPGSYNVVAEKGSKTMTILVPITNAHATEKNLTMPSENVNSVLEVKGEDTPEVVVGGLEQEAEQKKEAGKTVTVTMTVESKDETAAASDIKNTASGKTLDFLEIKVEKKVDEGTAEAITTTDKLLTIIIPFDFTGKIGRLLNPQNRHNVFMRFLIGDTDYNRKLTWESTKNWFMASRQNGYITCHGGKKRETKNLWLCPRIQRGSERGPPASRPA